MKIDRRRFIKTGAAVLTGTGTALKAAGREREVGGEKNDEKNGEKKTESAHVGCLVDTTLCIGCRKCEEACNRRNNHPRPEVPFSDKTVFRRKRRPTPGAFTVVNQYPGNPSPDQTNIKFTHCKVQCMHCLTPACVSACVVGAMVKFPDGSVVYNKDICLGCRYCMVACPFEIPAYEYWDPLTPRVRKCEFCANFKKKKGANPACAGACPTESLVFGKRKSLLTLAQHRIEERPDRYFNHIYGQKEAGGTSWLYLTGREPHTVDLLKMASLSPAVLTENIQHGIFKYGIIPLAVYGALSGLMWLNRRKEKSAETGGPPHTEVSESSEGAGENSGGAQ